MWIATGPAGAARTTSLTSSSYGAVPVCSSTRPRSGRLTREAMKRLTNRSSPSAVYASSPYFAWLSNPVPTQHQKQLCGDDTTR